MAFFGYARKQFFQDTRSASDTRNPTKYDNKGFPARSNEVLNFDRDGTKLQNSYTMRSAGSGFDEKIKRNEIEDVDDLPVYIRNLASIQNKMKSELDQHKLDIEYLKRQLVQLK